jgi:hypothetical protein
VSAVATKAEIQRVVAGRDAHLSLLVKGSHPDGTAASFKIMKAKDHSVLDTLDGQIKKGFAMTVWPAKGPDETGLARSHRVYYEVTVKNEKTTSPEMEVFYDSLEVTSLKEDGSPCPDAGFELFVKGMVQRAAHGSTGCNGVLEVTGLPPGDLSVEWASPLMESTCEEQTCKKYKAKLKATPCATLLFPKRGAHKQWVNHASAPKTPENGHLLRVRVGVHPSDGPSKVGHELYCKLEFPPQDQRSSRNDPMPGFAEGNASTLLLSKKVERDGGEVTFDVELGLAGGDKVTIHVGGTPECVDEKVEVTNWRKVYYQLTRPEWFKVWKTELMDKRLAEDGFIVYERFKEVAYKAEQLPADWKGCVQKGSDLGLGGADKDRTFLIGGNQLDDWMTSQLDAAKGKLGLNVCLVSAMIDALEQGKKTVSTARIVATLAQAQQDVPVPGGAVVFPKSLDDGQHPFIRGVWWPEGDATVKRGLPKEAVKIAGPGSRVKIVLPNTKAEDPGNLVANGIKVVVDVLLKAPNQIYLGAAWSRQQRVSMQQSGAEQVFNTVVAHELAHALKQAAKETPPGLGTHAYHYEGRGHVGHHCWFGLDAGGATHVAAPQADGSVTYTPISGAAHEQPDYSLVVKQQGTKYVGVSGSCIMFGAGPVADPTAATSGFCEACRPFLRAQAIDEIGS